MNAQPMNRIIPFLLLALFAALIAPHLPGGHAQAQQALTASASAGAIDLSWGPVSGAARYELWSWTSAGGWQQIGGDDLTATSYRHDNLTAGVTYYYQVRAVDASGAAGPWSERVSATVPGGLSAPALTATPTATATPAPPAIPGKFTGKVTNDGIVLSWTAPEGGADSYSIERLVPRHSKHGTVVIYVALGSSTSYTDRDVAVAGNYMYSIQAVRDELGSGWSDTLTVVVPESAIPTATGTPVQSTATPTPTSTPISLPTATATPTLTFSCANSEAIPDPEPPALVADCETLLGLKNELAGDATLNWSLSRPISTWQGVSASNINKRVSVLFLEELDLTGSVPAALGNLSYLRSLDLSDNRLTGSIPAALGNLANLQALTLTNNQLTGSIPSALGSLPKLQVLHLQDNQLSGAIPSALGSLAKLEGLFLYNNQLTGSIPSELSSLAKLENLYLSDNQLTGSIPSGLGSLTKLEWLLLDNNQLTGSIPSSLGSLAELKRLHLQNNELTSTIPAALDNLVPPTGKLLDVKIATGNSLCGPIPPALHAFIPAGAGENDLDVYDYPSGTLGDCSSSSPTSTATSTATPEATPTPTATSAATPEATPTPTATPASALPVPTLTAQAGADAVELRWKETPGAVRYELMVWWDAGTGWQPLGGANLTGTSYTHTNVTPGTTYYYSIRAVNAVGDTSTWSDFISVTVPASTLRISTPTLTLRSAQGEIELRWGEVASAARYELWTWWDIDVGWQQLDDGNLTGTNYTHTAVTAGTTYYYSIRSVSAEGEVSEWSEYVSTTAVASE